MNENLGKRFRDIITGFEGVCTARAEYITGCDQYLIQPTARKADGDIMDSRWFDVQRCQEVNAKPVVLDNGDTPGCDKPAPRR